MSNQLEVALKNEGHSEKKIAELVATFEKMSGGHMEPNIIETDSIEIDTNHGGQSIPIDALSKTELVKLKKLIENDDLNGVQQILHKYMEGDKLYSVDIKHGYLANLSAPGYLDKTDESLYATLAEAIEGLDEMYGDDGEDER